MTSQQTPKKTKKVIISIELEYSEQELFEQLLVDLRAFTSSRIGDEIKRASINFCYQDRETLFQQAIKRYGEPAQIIMCIEECNELSKVLCKTFRYNFDELLAHVREELADVQIMLKQMELIFGNFDHEYKLAEEHLRKKLAARNEKRSEAIT